MTKTTRRAVVVVASNRAAAGVYADRTGPVIVDWLCERGYQTPDPVVVPDGSPVRDAVATAVTAVYLAALGVILLWPDHLDRKAGAAYAVLYELFPGATPRTMDFGLNVVLFVPFGVVLGVVLRGHPWRLLGIACAVPSRCLRSR